jgi:hypothetical protein
MPETDSAMRLNYQHTLIQVITGILPAIGSA